MNELTVDGGDNDEEEEEDLLALMDKAKWPTTFMWFYTLIPLTLGCVIHTSRNLGKSFFEVFMKGF